MTAFFSALEQLCRPGEVSDLLIQPNQPLSCIRLGALETTGVLCTEPDFEDLMGRMKLDLSTLTLGDRNCSWDHNGFRFRVHLFRERGRPKVTARLLPNKIYLPKDLRIPTQLLDAVMGCKKGDGGIILVSGATGSGKSTTIASAIQMWARANPGHVVTLEDPVEVFFEDAVPMQFSQREVGVDVLSFADGLVSAMREAPTVIFIGEIRDQASALAALDAAKTGHLVLTTLHTDRVHGAIDSFLRNIPQSAVDAAVLTLSNKLRCVCCQRLYRNSAGTGMFAVHEILTIKASSFAIKSHILKREWSAIEGAVAVGSQHGHVSYKDSFAKATNESLIRPHEVDALLTSIVGNLPK